MLYRDVVHDFISLHEYGRLDTLAEGQGDEYSERVWW